MRCRMRSPPLLKRSPGRGRQSTASAGAADLAVLGTRDGENWRPDGNQNRAYLSRQTVQPEGTTLLRSDVAPRAGVTEWPSTFLRLVVESAVLGLRDLEMLARTHEKGRALAAKHARRYPPLSVWSHR